MLLSRYCAASLLALVSRRLTGKTKAFETKAKYICTAVCRCRERASRKGNHRPPSVVVQSLAFVLDRTHAANCVVALIALRILADRSRATFCSLYTRLASCSKPVRLGATAPAAARYGTRLVMSLARPPRLDERYCEVALSTPTRFNSTQLLIRVASAS